MVSHASAILNMADETLQAVPGVQITASWYARPTPPTTSRHYYIRMRIAIDKRRIGKNMGNISCEYNMLHISGKEREPSNPGDFQ